MRQCLVLGAGWLVPCSAAGGAWRPERTQGRLSLGRSGACHAVLSMVQFMNWGAPVQGVADSSKRVQASQEGDAQQVVSARPTLARTSPHLHTLYAVFGV